MATDKKSKAVVSEEIKVPDLSFLARVYKDSMAKSDATIAGAAEASAARYAAAEGALAEALALARFVDEGSA